MDAASPPSIVFESTVECADGDQAEVQFRQALGVARATGPGWAVTLRIGGGSPPAVSGEAEVVDASGNARARNVVAGVATDCATVARAAADWASVFLEDTRRLEILAPPPRAMPAPAPRPEASVSGAASEYERPVLELGIGAFFMVGGATGGYVGVSPFVVDQVGEGVFLRPSIGVGESLEGTPSATWLAARLDTCARLPGRYASRNGIQLDLCGGADAGFSYVASGTERGAPSTSKTLPYVDLGPSVSLRGEVGNFAVSLRAVVGIDVAHAGFVDATGANVDAPLLSWRLELDLSSALQWSR